MSGFCLHTSGPKTDKQYTAASSPTVTDSVLCRDSDCSWHSILHRTSCSGSSMIPSHLIYEKKGWEFALSLIRSLLFRSKSLILKSVRRPWSIRSRRTLKKSDHEWIALVSLYKRANRVKKRAIRSTFVVFFVCFSHCFSPFYAQEWITPVTLRSVNLF